MDHRTHDIIGALIEVHRHLGPGLLESVYETCVCTELSLRRIPFERQRRVPLVYKSVEVDGGFRLDLVVRNEVVIEVKAVEQFAAVHEAQVISYLRLSGLPLGLLVNFNVPLLAQHGLRRITREHPHDRTTARRNSRVRTGEWE